MGVYRRKDSKYWWITWWDAERKKQRYESTGFPLSNPMRDAKEVLKKREGDTAKGINAFPRHMTFAQAVEIFKRDFVVRKCDGTQEFYETCLTRLNKYFGPMKLTKITVQDIEDFRSKRQQAKCERRPEDNVKNATINRELAALGKLFTFAWKKEWVLRNPVRMLEPRLLHEAQQRKQAHYVDKVEEGKICAKAPEYLRDIVEIILHTGVRYEKELLPLRWENVDLKRRVMRIVESKTAAGVREIALNRAAFAILKRRKAFSKSEWVFPSPVNPGDHLRSLKTVWTKTLKDAEVAHFPIYNLRHTHRTRAKLAGVNPDVMREVMGHSDATMDWRYNLTQIDFQRKELNKLCTVVRSEQAAASRKKLLVQ